MVEESREIVRLSVELKHVREDLSEIKKTLDTMRAEREGLFVTRREMKAIQWLLGVAIAASAGSAALWFPRVFGG